MRFRVAPEDAGERLDVVLVRRVPDMSRAEARRLTAAGQVRLDGRIARKGTTLAAGSEVELAEAPRPSDFAAAPDRDVPCDVRWEDAHLVVVNKPAGMPSHPLRPDERGTLAGALVARYPEMAVVGYAAREPGLVHRLDNDTSGLVLAARDADTFRALREALASGALSKRYLALVPGLVEVPRRIDLPIANDPSDRRRVRCCATDTEATRLRAKAAWTEVVSAERVGADWSLVEAAAPLATRHQVRAHLAAIGHPLAGDALYGGPPVPELRRHFLHASQLSFSHPWTGARVRLDGRLPPDLEAVLSLLRGD